MPVAPIVAQAARSLAPGQRLWSSASRIRAGGGAGRLLAHPAVIHPRVAAARLEVPDRRYPNGRSIVCRYRPVTADFFVMRVLPALLLSACTVAAMPSARAEAQAGELQRFRLQLDYHPVGETLPKGVFRYSNLLRPHPAGFRADSFSMYFAPTYGLGNGWEASLGVTGASRIGPGGQALFYGGGVQKQVMTERGSRPAVSLGFTGMAGPHNHLDGMLYLAATKAVRRRERSGIFLHAGLKLNAYESDDFGSGSGLRPWGGVTAAISPSLTLSGEVSPPQPWEKSIKYAGRVTVAIRRNVGLSGGIRGNGYRTTPFIGLSLGGSD